MRILIIGGIASSLINFRGSLIKAMQDAGHEVIACAGEPDAAALETLRTRGVSFFPINLARAGMSPLGDLRTCLQLRGIMRAQRPDTVLAYTIKPVIWGGLAARLAGVPKRYSLITGLGYAFVGGGGETADCRLQTTDCRLGEGKKTAGGRRGTGYAMRFYRRVQERTSEQVLGYSSAVSPVGYLSGGGIREAAGPEVCALPAVDGKNISCDSRAKNTQPFKQRLVGWVAKRLYKFALRFSTKVFFQNPDDAAEFVALGLVAAGKCVVVSGSGIDLEQFQTADSNAGEGSHEDAKARRGRDGGETEDCRLQTADYNEGGRERDAACPEVCALPAEANNSHSGMTDRALQEPVTFLLIARLLWDKGIGEYVQAARLLKTEGNGGKTADCRLQTVDNGGKTEDRRRKTEDNGGKTADCRLKTEDNGGKTEDGQTSRAKSPKKVCRL